MQILQRVSVAALLVGFSCVPGLAVQHSVEPAQGQLLDLNRATREELAALPGMGGVYADRIIAGRPYRAKNQLTQRGILPARAYRGIEHLIVARRMNSEAR